MAFTIVRPGGLQNDAATGNGVLTADAGVCGSIARADVADVVIKALFSDKADGKTLTAVDAAKVTTKGAYEPFALK